MSDDFRGAEVRSLVFSKVNDVALESGHI